MSGRWVAVAGALALVVVPITAGCDDAPKKSKATSISASVQECRDQWHDVAESVLGLDQDTDPSALASRWTTVLATVDYYENTTTAEDCQARVENQVNAITALRQFSDRLRPYDMEYQREQVAATVDLYLHDPVPAPVKGANGKTVKAPTHEQVEAAVATLTAHAAEANAELQPAWEHLASVSIDDDAAVTAALEDLDALAQAGKAWPACQQALQVIVAAQRAQEGLLGTPEDQPSGSPTGSPTGTPTGTPTS
ncbi:hypothetical protein [Nocardioides marmorisolisilvae]|uniref:Uncharacterized protein n=1 Tax=Nocardioides marmorisolisilvae TaxID=1542737 RepID=A0A3N0DW10_9ACTN|nr:hypothetical protein [Nocardioides marmorisolisilvae]RNL79812.1 hypothetical protein EFL95_12755 [Nocardioides marmorisolisilvae]